MAPLELLAFGPDEARELSGITMSQFRAWPFIPRDGSSLLSFQNLVELRVLAELRRLGVLPAELERAARVLHQYAARPWSDLRLGVNQRKVVFQNPGTGKWETADGTQQINIPIVVAKIAEELERIVRERRGRRDKSTHGKVAKDRGVVGGRPRIAGTRIEVAHVRRLIEDGWSDTRILQEYPALVRKDIAAVRKLAAAS